MKESGLAILFVFSISILHTNSSNAQTLYWQSIYPEIFVYDMLCDGGTNLYVTASETYPYFYRSTDLGNTWTRLGNGYFDIKSLAMDSSDVLWAGNTGSGGIYKSTDQGDNWSNSLNSNDIISYLIVSSNNWIWAGTTAGKIIFSSDHGVSWASDSIGSETISCIAANHQNDIFAGSWDGKVYRTTDSGATWETVYNIVPIGIWGMVIDSSDIIYAYKWNKCLVSSDNGNTWIEIPGPQLEGLFLDPFENIYAPEGYRTLDKCSTWTYIGPPVNFPRCYCFSDSLVFAGTGHGIFLYDPSYHPYSGHNYFPLSVGNKWQYNTKYNGHIASNSAFSVEKDSIIYGRKYYLLQGAIHDWVRYDNDENTLYLRWNNSDYTVMNFDLNEGSQFQHISYNTHYLITATVIEPANINLFDTTFFSKGYRYSMNYNESDRIYHSENLGEISDEYYSWIGGTGTDIDSKLIRAIIYDSTGIRYYSDHVKPVIIFQPQTVTHSFSLNWNFSVNHSYSGFNQYWNVNFIDTVLMYSYYSNGITTINNLPREAINEPNSINYNISYQLDSTKMKNNFKFYYKIYAVDKGIVPESSWKPDSGYYELVYDPNPVSVEDKDIPVDYSLQQNFPNPFNPSTIIKYSVPSKEKVTVKVYDVLGTEVATLVNEEKPAGTYQLTWNAVDLPSGVYFYRMRAGSYTATKKLILLK